ncbi:MAG: hypothetical protein KAG26_00595 [Methylococcales bacterium]|nr:hypothetical protein [Methylococcales bacterium]
MIKKIITTCFLMLIITSCTDRSLNQIGASLGSNLANQIPGVGGRIVRSTVRVLVKDFVVIIGGQLKLTLQDKKNLEQVWNNTDQTQAVAWCSNAQFRSNQAKNVKCKKGNKITATAGKVVKTNDEEICRTMKTEVEKPNGEIATETQNLCKNKAGKWYEKK